MKVEKVYKKLIILLKEANQLVSIHYKKIYSIHHIILKMKINRK